MPTATPFVALGRGNGFPFCLSVGADTSDTDWCRNLTVGQAMSTWWLPYTIRLEVSWRSAFTDSSVSPPVWIDSTQAYDVTAEYGSALTVPLEPVGRVCLDIGDLTAASTPVTDVSIVSLIEAIDQSSGSYATRLRIAGQDLAQTYPEQYIDMSTASGDLLGVQDTIDLSTPWGTVTLYGTSNVGGGSPAEEFELLSATLTITDWTF